MFDGSSWVWKQEPPVLGVLRTTPGREGGGKNLVDLHKMGISQPKKSRDNERSTMLTGRKTLTNEKGGKEKDGKKKGRWAFRAGFEQETAGTGQEARRRRRSARTGGRVGKKEGKGESSKGRGSNALANECRLNLRPR